MGLMAPTDARAGADTRRLRTRVLGLDFPGPVGLGAGYDRTGERLPELDAAGFGFVELGTVTAEPVAGHNPGVAALVAAIGRHRAARPRAADAPLIGINLGRQPDRPLREAGRDFEIGLRGAWACADYLAINLTGPAAQPLHAAEHRRELWSALERALDAHARLTTETSKRVPLLLKQPIAPGGRFDEFHALHFDGLIAVFQDAQDGSPGCPGQRDIVRLAEFLGPTTVLVAGSGIGSADDAARCLAAGARLVQVHRAYVERGASLIARINRQLAVAAARQV
jgi:dihydroorotate dehydrogenase